VAKVYKVSKEPKIGKQKQYKFAQRVKAFHFPVFSNWKLLVIFTNNMAKTLRKYPQTRCIEKESGDYALTVNVPKEDLTFVVLPHDCCLRTVAHEAFHAMEHILGAHDISLSGEIGAYHMGYLVREISKWRSTL